MRWLILLVLYEHIVSVLSLIWDSIFWCLTVLLRAYGSVRTRISLFVHNLWFFARMSVILGRLVGVSIGYHDLYNYSPVL